MFRNRLFKNIDWQLVFVVLIITCIGLISIYSATYQKSFTQSQGFLWDSVLKNLLTKQLMWVGVGLLIVILMASVNYHKILDMAYLMFGLNIALLLVVLVLGRESKGAVRWIEILGFGFQPSEFMKLTFILSLAYYLGRQKSSTRELFTVLIALIITGASFALIFKQPDLGTALLFLPVFFSMIYVAGAKKRHMFSISLAGLLSMPLIWHMLKSYQKQRLMVFLNPNIDPLGAGYTIIQSKIAIGSGQFFGKGWLAGTQNQLNFLPERHTDFIFSIIGEEWGFLGALVLLLLYVIFITKSMRIASQTKDPFGILLVTGITTLFATQVFINIAMTLGIMPVVGITLPFVSYGGSSIIVSYIMLGLLLNVGMRRTVF